MRIAREQFGRGDIFVQNLRSKRQKLVFLRLHRRKKHEQILSDDDEEDVLLVRVKLCTANILSIKDKSDVHTPEVMMTIARGRADGLDKSFHDNRYHAFVWCTCAICAQQMVPRIKPWLLGTLYRSAPQTYAVQLTIASRP